MQLDLSGLDEKPVIAAPTFAAGKPLDIPLSDIDEDPDQPRVEISDEGMRDITASIKQSGVKTPVSLRSHPTISGRWILNYGARRYRGSKLAGRSTIPAFIDETHNNYDQVIENIQRDDLKPMELALFIKKRLAIGEKPSQIAKKLGKDASTITQHRALIDPPSCIEEVYASGKCVSPKTLYELRSLYEKFPEPVMEWCSSSPEITRKGVSDLASDLIEKKKPRINGATVQDEGELSASESENQTEIQNDSLAQVEDSSPEEPTGIEKNSKRIKTKNKDEDASDEIEAEENDHGELTSWPKGRAVSDPNRMSKPLLIVEFEGRPAAILLNRRPTKAGLIHIRFEDGGGDQEVYAGECKINVLTEGPV